MRGLVVRHVEKGQEVAVVITLVVVIPHSPSILLRDSGISGP